MDVPASAAPERMRPLALGAILLGTLAVLFPTVLLGDDFFFCRDGATLYAPMWVELKDRLARGELPLWFPYDGLGEPFLGNALSATFHPLGLALRFLSVAQAMRWTMLAAYAAAFLGTYALARAVGAARWAAVVAAIAFSCSGSLVSLTNNPTYLFGGAVFPLFVLGVVRAGTEPIRGGVISALALALAAVGGDFQTVLVMAVSGGVLVLLQAGSWRGRLIALGQLAASGLSGAALSAVQLLPAAATLGQVDRGSGLEWTEATQWSLHPLRLPELALGDLIHWVPGSASPNLIRQELIGSVGLWSVTVTVGAPLLIGCVYAMVRLQRSRVEVSLAVTGALTLGLALGRYGGLYQLAFRVLPLWSAFRFPEKLTLHASLFIAVLGARGLQWLMREAGGRRPFLLGVGGLAALLPLVAVLAWRLGDRSGATGEAWGEYWLAMARAGALTLGVLALLGGLLWRGSPLFAYAAPLLCLVQLYPSSSSTAGLCTAPRWTADVPSAPGEAIRALEGGSALGKARVTPAFSVPGTLTLRPAAGDLTPSVATAMWQRQMLYPASGTAMQLESMGRIIPVRPRRYQAFHAIADLRFWPLYNTRYVVTARSDLGRLAGLRTSVAADLPQLDAVVVRLEDALPRAYVARPLPTRDAGEAALHLGDPEVLAGHAVLVEGAESGVPGPVTGSVQVTRYASEEVILDAELSAPGAVVLNDSDFDGWVATVDGAAAPILPANLLVRAVRVGPGRHQVVFRYPLPASVKAGLVVSALAWAALLALGAASWIRRRRARTGG